MTRRWSRTGDSREMTTVQSATQPSFVFGRIARNRLAYVLAVVLLIAAVAPLVLAGGYGLAALVARYAGSQTKSIASRVSYEERFMGRMKSLPDEDQPDGEGHEYLQ